MEENGAIVTGRNRGMRQLLAWDQVEEKKKRERETAIERERERERERDNIAIEKEAEPREGAS